MVAKLTGGVPLRVLKAAEVDQTGSVQKTDGAKRAAAELGSNPNDAVDGARRPAKLSDEPPGLARRNLGSGGVRNQFFQFSLSEIGLSQATKPDQPIPRGEALDAGTATPPAGSGNVSDEQLKALVERGGADADTLRRLARSEDLTPEQQTTLLKALGDREDVRHKHVMNLIRSIR